MNLLPKVYGIIFFILASCSVGICQPVANFSGTPVNGCAPLVVSFTDLSTGSPTSWQWDLGNTTLSTQQNPTTTYFNPGTYTITLIASNASGSNTITKTQYITVHSQPNVNFLGSPLSGCFPLPVQFTDLSTAGSGTISSRQWDFGDGIFSSLISPPHTYTSAGNFNVSLRIVNSMGCFKTLTKPQYILINAGVHADFTNSVSGSCNPPATINFQNLSTGTGLLNYLWNFGDGTTSTIPNPSHIYNSAGSYTVSLIAVSPIGCTDTITKVNSVVIGSVHASFTSLDTVCGGSPVFFTNTSIPTPISAVWDFGDGTTSTLMNPVKSYASPGTYQVKLSSNFGTCSDSSYKPERVLASPTANFTATPLSSCKPPLTVHFTNQSINGVSYNWDFGDGGNSTLPNPMHTYISSGNFTVTLIITSSLGCTDTLRRTNYINIQGPQGAINNLPDSGCAPFSHSFSATINSIDPVTNYLWDFGDGTTSTAVNPTHIFGAGIFNIRLIIKTAGGCSDTINVFPGISAGVKPVPNFSATPTAACARTPINFLDLSTGNVTGWLWRFGDGSTSTDQNPMHQYQDTGYFDVQLIVWNNGCKDSIKFVRYIHIKPPIAIYSYTSNCINPKQRIFTDQSIGADEWHWDFGDGNTSTVQNPIHIYADTGSYVVTLRVVNDSTGCDFTTMKTVKVLYEKANFISSDTSICKYHAAIFTATGNNSLNVASYEWTFGDGTAGISSPVSHIYMQAGLFDIRLIVTDTYGCKDTLVKPAYLRVSGPTSNFGSAIPGTCLNSSITFNDSSITDGLHPIVKWIWNFGDGIIDTLTSPPFQHTYASSGLYSVSLSVTDNNGCIDTIQRPAYILISTPVANFSSADTMVCPNRQITFTNLSTGPLLTYTWHFGDGTTSTAANPVHLYPSDGIYTVRLFIADQFGCTDSITKLNYIRILTPHADFTMSDSVTTCAPLVVNFTNTSSNYVSVLWDFGDSTFTQLNNPSHFYSYSGNYTVRLTISGPGNCTDVKEKHITVRGPRGTFTYGPSNGCSPLQIHMMASTQDRLSFIWDFSDGTTISSTDSIVTHTYVRLGNYLPKMILVDSAGCQVPITGVDTIKVRGVTSKFGFLSHALCDSGYMAFTDSSVSNDNISSYAWNFGDGSVSSLQNPIHHYSSTGLYYPRLVVVTQSGCRDTSQTPVPVKVVSTPRANVVHTPDGCVPLSVTFNGTLLIPDTSAISWNWSFGNGNSSAIQNPSAQNYTVAAAYPVQMIAQNSSGCKDTVNTVVNAFGVPVVSAGVDTMICKGVGVTLNASGALNYTWTPAAGLSCTNCASPIATPDSITNYVVTGTILHGCNSKDTVQVRVKYPFAMNNSKGDTLCTGGSVRLFASGAFAYTWSPSTGLNSTNSSTPLASPSVSTVYRVIGTDDHGCFKDTGYVPVKIYPFPTVEAGPDKTINAGQSVELIPALSADVSNVLWTPAAGIITTNSHSIIVKPRETTQYTITVKNAGGCTAKDKVTVFVICNGANVFIPNTFSPNGDGINDIFYPRGTGLFSIKAMRVFNRWGEMVFEKTSFLPNDPSSGWNGIFKGVKLTPDVFVYTLDIICDNSSILSFKGNITLLQ